MSRSEGQQSDAEAAFAAFLERWHAGEQQLDELCDALPEHADLFRTWWSRLESLGEVTTSAGGGAPTSTPLAQLGPFEVLREIGRGGQGAVHLARDTRLGRLVALKVLSGFDTSHPDRLVRFRREAEMAARLDHPSICTVYEAGVADGVPYISMRWIDGETLARRIERIAAQGSEEEKRRFREAAIEEAEIVARALHEAHESRLVHRDVKPGNIMLDRRGVPVILDFGLARDLEGEGTRVTLSGAIFGTPAYMAPEQIDHSSGPVDRVTDVYALGATLFEWIALRRPFSAPTRQALFRAVLEQEPPRLRDLVPGLPADLSVVVATALEKPRERRYATALDLAEDLARIRRGEPVSVRAPGPALRLARWARRRPTLAALLLVLVIGLLSTGYLLREANAARIALQQRNADYRRMADVKRLQTLKVDAHKIDLHGPVAQAALDDWLGRAESLLGRMPQHRASLQRLRENARPVSPHKPVRWELEDSELQWEHDVIAGLAAEVEAFQAEATGLLHRVRGWREFAASVRRRSVEAPAWKEVIEAAAREDGVYRGLALEPQIGLVPLGPDPESGLQEFAHLLTGEVPARAEDGTLTITEASGLVLVLLPGGRFRMGAVRPDAEHRRGEPNVDPMATKNESPITEIELAPFFISKYEMTQAQWLRFTGKNPSAFHPDYVVHGAEELTLQGPVDSVTWHDCQVVLGRLGLVIPTEAQWEYAARAGTTTPWYSGEDRKSIEGHANLADETALGVLTRKEAQIDRWLEDGFVLAAPVGSFYPNDFGLHDVMGNVWEWTRDTYPHYSIKPASGDGYLEWPLKETRAYRGGSWTHSSNSARSASRVSLQAGVTASDHGVRPARPLAP